MNDKQKKLLYQCWYRGCRETDRLLGAYAKQHIGDMEEAQLDTLEALLEESDQDIYEWLTEQQALPANSEYFGLISNIRQFHSR